MKKSNRIVALDFIPPLAGLIGKISLVSSFAMVWAEELGISHKTFVIENVRIELLVGSIISLIGVLFLENVVPAGTLAPLVVLIPFMVAWGVHPLILGLLVGFFGWIAVKTKLLEKLTSLSGQISKTSIVLAFGIQGIYMSAQKIMAFYKDNLIGGVLLFVIVTLFYFIALKLKKAWLVIPAIVPIVFVLSFLEGNPIKIAYEAIDFQFGPDYWWNTLWGIGYGWELETVIRTIPFALFVIVLWGIDIVAIQTVQESMDNKTKMNIKDSFLLVSLRNIVGAIFGGSQTGSLWRSYLIPLFTTNTNMKKTSIILCILGIVSAITWLPITILSYPPLTFSVLLFGVFLPLTLAALKNYQNIYRKRSKIATLILGGIGIFFNPLIAWGIGLAIERFGDSGCKDLQSENSITE